MHGACQSEEGLPRLRNLLICIGMANRKAVLHIKLPACRCQQDGRLPVSWHTKGTLMGAGVFQKECDKNGCRDYAEPRMIPSFCILNWRVDRFIPRSPFGYFSADVHHKMTPELVIRDSTRAVLRTESENRWLKRRGPLCD